MKIARGKPKRGGASKHRAYRQDIRAQQTEENIQGIVDAAVALVWSVRRITDITLDDIAAKCGLTVRTILRRFGSRDGILEAAFAQLFREVDQRNQPTPAGDIEAGLNSLLSRYEHMGDLNLRGLEEEDQLPSLHELLETARDSHRNWLGHVFGPHLSGSTQESREQTILALYAATDVYLWKLLRRDLQLDIGQTAKTLRQLVAGALKMQSEGRKRRGN